jgi:hypothetical protein
MNTQTEYDSSKLILVNPETIILKDALATRLTRMTKEMRKAWPDLLAAQSSIALLINDFMDCAGLDEREREVVLGHALYKQINKNLDDTVQLTIPLDAIPAMPG